MNTFLQIVLFFGLGAVAGFFCHRKPDAEHIWGPSALAATIASVVWLGGVYVFLWFNAPNALGPPMLWSIIKIWFLSFFCAAAVGGVKCYWASKNVQHD